MNRPESYGLTESDIAEYVPAIYGTDSVAVRRQTDAATKYLMNRYLIRLGGSYALALTTLFCSAATGSMSTDLPALVQGVASNLYVLPAVMSAYLLPTSWVSAFRSNRIDEAGRLRSRELSKGGREQLLVLDAKREQARSTYRELTAKANHWAKAIWSGVAVAAMTFAATAVGAAAHAGPLVSSAWGSVAIAGVVAATGVGTLGSMLTKAHVVDQMRPLREEISRMEREVLEPTVVRESTPTVTLEDAIDEMVASRERAPQRGVEHHLVFTETPEYGRGGHGLEM